MRAASRSRPYIPLTPESLLTLGVVVAVLAGGTLAVRAFRAPPESPLVGRFVSGGARPVRSLTLRADGEVAYRTVVQNVSVHTGGTYTTAGDTAFITFRGFGRQWVGAVALRSGNALAVRMRVNGDEQSLVRLVRAP